MRELPRGLCTAAGLCLERAGCALCKQVEALRGQAAVVQAAVVRSQAFRRAMLDGLPEWETAADRPLVAPLATLRSLQASGAAMVPR